jgi:autotransporter adhesin
MAMSEHRINTASNFNGAARDAGSNRTAHGEGDLVRGRGVSVASMIALAVFAAWGPARADTAIGGIKIDNLGGAVCTTPDRPSSPSSAWTCQVPNGSGGFATISGLASNSSGFPDTAALSTWVGSKLGAGAIAIGNTATAASGSNAIEIGPAAQAIGDNSISLGNGSRASAAGNVSLGHGAAATTANSVALGANSTTGAATSTAGTTIQGTAYTFAGGTSTGVVSVGSVGGERQVTHVAAGQLSASSTDAVNGSQLFATNQAINSLAVTASAGIHVTTAATGTGVAIGSSMANVAPAGTNTTFAVNPNPSFNSVTVGGTTISAAGVAVANGPSLTTEGVDAGGKIISRVAPGINGTDAVNMNQFNAGIDSLRQDVVANRKEAQAGVAGAMAMAGMPQAYLPGKSMLAAGAASFKGQTAIAVGLSTISDNGKWVTKITGSANTRGDVGVSVGAGYQW